VAKLYVFLKKSLEWGNKSSLSTRPSLGYLFEVVGPESR
jgi:hypothetical protein